MHMAATIDPVVTKKNSRDDVATLPDMDHQSANLG